MKPKIDLDRILDERRRPDAQERAALSADPELAARYRDQHELADRLGRGADAFRAAPPVALEQRVLAAVRDSRGQPASRPRWAPRLALACALAAAIALAVLIAWRAAADAPPPGPELVDRPLPVEQGSLPVAEPEPLIVDDGGHDDGGSLLADADFGALVAGLGEATPDKLLARELRGLRHDGDALAQFLLRSLPIGGLP